MKIDNELGPSRGGIGNNPIRSRDHNRRVMLDLLRQHGPLGRKELAAGTQLTAPAVANILDDLVAEGIILDLGRKRSGRGQPPLQFTLNPKGAYTLGFEIGVNGVVVSALDLLGAPILERRLNDIDLSPNHVLSHLRKVISEADELGNGKSLGAGVVMPGPLHIDSMAIGDPTTLPGWEGIDEDAFSEALGLQVWVENDANAAALSEALFGVAAHLHNVAVLYFGYGVGLGVISSGRLIRGARGHAGEIGHIVTKPNGRLCSCGQNGCFERYVSRYALSEHLGVPLSTGTVTALWQEQDPRLLEWIADGGVHLAPLVTMIENILDPDTIVLAGQLPTEVLQALINATRLNSSIVSFKDGALPRLQVGNAGSFIAARGAAALPFYGALTPQSA